MDVLNPFVQLTPGSVLLARAFEEVFAPPSYQPFTGVNGWYRLPIVSKSSQRGLHFVVEGALELLLRHIPGFGERVVSFAGDIGS